MLLIKRLNILHGDTKRRFSAYYDTTVLMEAVMKEVKETLERIELKLNQLSDKNRKEVEQKIKIILQTALLASDQQSPQPCRET